MNRQFLDSLIPGRPVVLSDESNHYVPLNTKTLHKYY